MGYLHSPTALIVLLIALLASNAVATVQYCDSKFHFCFAASRVSNVSSGSHDVYLTISAKPSSNGGWIGIGFGHEMNGALMLIIYEDQARKSLVTSIRTATGHTMPNIVPDADRQVSVLDSTIANGQYTAQFVCHTCWSSDATLEEMSPMIFAGNRDQAFRSADEHTSLMYHDFSGRVWANTTAAMQDSSDGSPPLIHARKSIGTITDSSKASASSGGVFTPVRVHGTIMTFSFMGLYFAGSVAIRSPTMKAFKYHWMIQAGASILALSNGLYMFRRSTHFGPHKIIGLTILILLIVQAAAGYKHHIDFVKIRRQTIFTLVHRWLGRGILLFGTMNVGLGMYYRKWSFLGLFIWFVLWCTEIIGYGFVLRSYNRRRSQQRKKFIPKCNSEQVAGAKVFGIGGDFDEDEDEVEGVPLMHR